MGSDNRIHMPPRPGKSADLPTRPKIPALLQFGRDLTREAAQGKLQPVVGRDHEIDLMMETLCRRYMRNPSLVGPAGVGKTAIVEGFAQRVVRGDVPEILKGVTVVLLQPTLIVSGSGQTGVIEKRMSDLIGDASQEGIILFIDELHTIIGAGGDAGTADIASMMKPVLARGDIACIAATTDDEYRRFIEQDPALERRFFKIPVHEMSHPQAYEVLEAQRDELLRLRGVFVGDDVLHRLMDYAEKFMRNKAFPDKAVNLLEQCVANALTRGDKEVDLSEADTVVQRMIGMPLDLESRLNKIKGQLAECSHLNEKTIEAMVNRLQVTMRGLDVRAARPNAVMLLADTAAERAGDVASCLSSALFETPERVVKIDMGRLQTPGDASLLLGSPPGYVGYGETLPIHRIKQFPWTIVLFENVDTCAPQYQQLLAQALSDGFFVDGQNRKIYLSDIVAILTARGVRSSEMRSVGFGVDEQQSPDIRSVLRKHLDTALVDMIDLAVSEMSDDAKRDGNADHRRILADLVERYQKYGIQLNCDQSLYTWLENASTCERCLDWERHIDESLSPIILEQMKELQGKNQAFIVRYADDRIIVETPSNFSPKL